MQQIVPIQFLRAFAALGVALAHYQFDRGRLGLHDNLPSLSFGQAGVDVFFVISGFVMVYTSERCFGQPSGPREFFLRRLVRIVPLYWLVTTLYLAIAMAGVHPNGGYSGALAAASYLFIPMERLPGVVQPVVGQGWTLNYEMFFYAIFALAVVARQRIAVAAVSVVLIAVVLLGRVFAPLPVPLAFWSDDIVIEFVFGMLLGLAYREGLRLPKVAGLALVVLGCLAIYQFSPVEGSVGRLLAWGLPATCIVAGASLPDFTPSAKRWRPLALAGDASYALYLTHSFAIRAVLFLAVLMHIDLAAASWLYLLAAMAGAVLIAVAIHIVFERPVTAALKRALAQRERAAVPTGLQQLAPTESS